MAGSANWRGTVGMGSLIVVIGVTLGLLTVMEIPASCRAHAGQVGWEYLSDFWTGCAAEKTDVKLDEEAPLIIIPIDPNY